MDQVKVDKLRSQAVEGMCEAVYNQYLFCVVPRKMPCFSTLRFKSKTTYPLHVAAAMGDVESLAVLLKPEMSPTLLLFKIESRDDLNLTPLQVAAATGQVEAVKFLLSKGADVYARGGYDQDFSALELAVIENHAEIVKILVQEGQALKGLSMNELAHLTGTSLDTAWLNIREADENPEIFDAALDIFLTVVKAQDVALIEYDEGWLYPKIVSESAISLLETMAENAPTKAIYDRILAEVYSINQNDSCYQTYLEAKLLFHVLPVSEPYYTLHYTKTDGTDYPSKINPEGLMECFVTPFVSESIDFYKDNIIKQDHSASLAFEHISQIYHQAVLFSKEPGNFENSKLAFDLYKSGQTVLLTTGWDGHAVNIILDPTHQYFIVANGGDRYEGLASGANIYKIHNIKNLTPELIFDILNNEDVIDLELTYKYQLALDRVEVLNLPEQTHGNCAWYSHKPTIEALLYIDFLNQGLDNKTAKALAKTNYIDWDANQKMYALEIYFENDPRVDIDAVRDILVENHPTLFNQSKSTPIDPMEYQRAEYLVKVLSTDQYKSDFYKAFADDFKNAKVELLELFESANLLPSAHEQAPPVQPIPLEDVFSSADSDSHAPQFDLHDHHHAVLSSPTLSSVWDNHQINHPDLQSL